MKRTLLAFLLATIVTTVSIAQLDPATKEKPTGEHPGVIVYSAGGAFLIQGPTGWIADSETGQRLGICCVFYSEGSTWDNAETVIYPNIATKGPGQSTLEEFMDYDLSGFRESNSRMTYEDGHDIPIRNSRVAKLRFFYGVNKGASEAIAYVDEEKVIALIVVSSRTRKGLNAAMPLLHDMLNTYSYMDVRFAPGAKLAQ